MHFQSFFVHNFRKTRNSKQVCVFKCHLLDKFSAFVQTNGSV